jgi:hypothetical protein
MTLRTAEVNIGAGRMQMDLRGEPKHDYSVQVHGGVGKATMYLPKNVAIADGHRQHRSDPMVR